MTLTIHADPVPLRVDESGAIRVGPTRVLFYLVIEAYQSGKAPEAIAHSFTTVRLADVYAAIAYYLNHQEEVDVYLRQRNEEAAQLRRKIEANQRPGPTREELLKRWAERKLPHAAPGQ